MGWRERIAQLTGQRPAVQSCKTGTGDICVIVSRRDNPAAGVPGCSVTLTGPTPGAATTDASGVAEFRARKPGAYKHTVSLPAGGDKMWKLVTSSGGASVGGGGIGSDVVEAYPIGTLIVNVFDDLGRRVEADTSSSVAPLSGAPLTRHTNADLFMTVVAGAASINAVAHQPHLYATQTQPLAVDVPQGGTARAAIVLRVLNIVTPSLVPASEEVWFLRPDPVPVPVIQPPPPQGSVAVAPGSPPPPTVRSTHVDQPVALQLGIVESLPSKPYTGTGTLSFDAARLQLHRDAACVTPPLAAGTLVTNGELKAGLTLYMKGKDAGVSNIDLSLTASGNADVLLTRPAVAKPVTVQEINVVEPAIKVEHRVVVFDQKLSKHQKRGEPEKFDPPPTFVDLSATLRIAVPTYAKTATLQATPAHVEMFTDEACKMRFDAAKPIPIDKLTGPTALRLYLKGPTTGTFELKLTLAPSGDPHIIVEHAAKVPMGVVQLRMALHQHDHGAVAALTVDPDVATYHADLEALELPLQKLMTEKEKVADGRLLHVQDGVESFGRAKLLVKKLVASEWPAGVDNYKLVLTSTCASGTVKVFDKDGKDNPAGVELPLPVELKVADLLAAERVLWVEGSATSTDWRSIRLDLGLDRADPASDHHVSIGDKKVKGNGDWARLTVVKLDNLRVLYKQPSGKANAWNAAANRFYINLLKDPGGRAMKIGADLVPPLEGVKLHLMLAPHANNREAANWGIDMPAAWTWETLTADVKHKDRKTRSAFLSYEVETDKEGKVKKSVVLSRFGGDKFWPAAHLAQDPHLAKFVDGHAALGLRKPALRAQPVEVYRKFWVRRIAVAGIPAQAFGGATGQYNAVKAEMVTEPDLVLSAATVAGFKPQAIYPRHMIEVGGGAANVLVVSDPNKGNFFKTFKSDGDKPNTVPILVCDAQWDPIGETMPANVPGQLDTVYPVAFDVGEQVLDPPLQGGKLVVSGTCVAHDWVAGAWVNERSVKLHKDDVMIDPARPSLKHLQLNIPASIIVIPGLTSIRFDGLSVKYAKSYLGESFKKRILAVFDPTDPGDFQNTIAHELGHSFKQVIRGDGSVSGLPPHPEQVDAGQGNHCVHNVNECVMFASSQAPAARLNNYCTVCQPYLLVQDMSVTI